MNPNETQKRRLPDYLKRLFTIKAMSVILIIALLIFGVIGWNKYPLTRQQNNLARL